MEAFPNWVPVGLSKLRFLTLLSLALCLQQCSTICHFLYHYAFPRVSFYPGIILLPSSFQCLLPLMNLQINYSSFKIQSKCFLSEAIPIVLDRDNISSPELLSLWGIFHYSG